MIVRPLAIAAIVLTAPAAVPPSSAAAQSGARTNYAANAAAWTIGPIARGRNRSRGMPLHPSRHRGGGFVIDLPRAPGSVHYVTFRHGSLAGKSRIVMRYRIEVAPGVRIAATTAPGSPGMLTPYFQRAGDTWTARGAYEQYRWYGTLATVTPLVAGERTLIAPFSSNWTAVEGSQAQRSPAGFRAAMVGAGEVGFVLGGGDGYGHGIFATGPARLIVSEFRIE